MNPAPPLLTSASNAQVPTVEPPRRHDSDWHRTIASIRKMLAGLERPCEAIDENLKQKQAKAAAWVSSLVEKLVAAATAETEAAVRQTRAEADVHIAQMQALVTHLLGESEVQRQEISQLLQQLEAEKATNRRLTVAFEAFQRAVSFVEPAEPPSQPTFPTPHTSEPHDEPVYMEPDAEPAAIRPLKLVSTTAGAESDPALAEYLEQLFDQIESSYWTDLEAAMGPAHIVDRLTENLRHAHDVFGRRVNSANSSEATLFEQKLTTLLDSKSETSFGRHLAVAAYNYAPPQAKATQTRAEAS